MGGLRHQGDKFVVADLLLLVHDHSQICVAVMLLLLMILLLGLQQAGKLVLPLGNPNHPWPASCLFATGAIMPHLHLLPLHTLSLASWGARCCCRPPPST